QAGAIPARQKLEPFTLVPAEDRHRLPARTGNRPRPPEVGGYAKDTAHPEAPGHLQRELGAEGPGIGEGGGREPEVLLERGAAQLELRGDERREFPGTRKASGV